ncbi:MAG: substrate-binding periplasmic protein [Inhella sp.]
MIGRRPLLALAGFSALPVRASCKRPLIAGVSPLGYAVFEAEGALRGFAVDIVRRVGQGVNCKIALSLRPRARVMLDFQRGELDLVTSSLRNPERDLVGDFEPYAYSGYELIVHPSIAERLQRIGEVEAMTRISLGLVRGVQLPGPVGPLVERLAVARRIEWAVDFQNLAARMAAGRVLVGVFPTAIHTKLLQDGELPANLIVRPLPESPPQPVGMYLNRQRLTVAQRERLRTALRRLVHSGEVQRIYTRYLGAEATQRMFEAGRYAAGGLRV